MSSLRNSYAQLTRQEIDTRLELARREILRSYGDHVTIGRKSLDKYGRNPSVTGTEVEITPINQNEIYLNDNLITHFSSSDAGDSGLALVEGMELVNGNLRFVTQTVTVSGQNKVALTTPLARHTRGRGVFNGTVYFYEDTAITAGVPNDTTKIKNRIEIVDNTSLKAGTSIAANNYFILMGFWATLDKSSGSGSVANIRLKIKNLNDSVLGDNFFTNTVRSCSLSAPLNYIYPTYYIVKPNSDIVLTASASSGTLDVTAGFFGHFADIQGFTYE